MRTGSAGVPAGEAGVLACFWKFRGSLGWGRSSNCISTKRRNGLRRATLMSGALSEDYTYGFKQAEVLGALLSIAAASALLARY